MYLEFYKLKTLYRNPRNAKILEDMYEIGLYYFKFNK